MELQRAGTIRQGEAQVQLEELGVEMFKVGGVRS